MGLLTQLTYLSLTGQGLQGTVPASIGRLTLLQHLDLSKNNFREDGTFPMIGNLTQLTNLNLNGLWFRALPDRVSLYFEKLPSLVSLDLRRNGFSTIPPAILEMNKLTKLTVCGGCSTGCSFAGPLTLDGCKVIPTAISNLKRLASLDVRFKGEIEPAMNALASLTTLTSLQVTGAFRAPRGSIDALTMPSAIFKLTRLSHLVYGDEYGAFDSPRAAPFPSSIGILTALTHLLAGGFKGSIPTEIGKLTNLTSLYISYLSDFSNPTILGLPKPQGGTLPSEIGKLTRLQSLTLNSITIKGSIPSSIGKLTLLQSLRLSVNANGVEGFKGSIPTEIGKLTNLISLQVSRLSTYASGLTGPSGGTLPSEIGKLTLLQSLTLNSNLIEGSIPSSTGKLTLLQSLSLDGNSLAGSIPTWIGKLSKLKYLSFAQNQLRGNLPSEISQLTRLEWLNLGFNMLVGTIPPSFGELTRLPWLSLESNMLVGTIPPSFGQLTRLEMLNLSRNKLTGTIPSALGKLRPKFVGINNNGLTGGIPSTWCPESYYGAFFQFDCEEVECPCSSEVCNCL